MLSTTHSQQFRFWAFVSMVCLVFVHGYNLNIGYLQPWTTPNEPLTMTGFTEYWLANGILRFRIPMLFIISGYLFAMAGITPYRQRMGKRVRTLLYPYLFWSAAGLLLTFILECFAPGREVIAATHMVQIDAQRLFLHEYHWYEGIIRWIFFPVSYQLWFIRVLLVYNLAYPAIRWCITHRVVKWIFFALVIIFWVVSQGLILVEGEGLLFFALGVWIQQKKFNIDSPPHWLPVNLWLAIFLLLSLAKTWVAFLPFFEAQHPILLLSHKIVVFSGLVCAWYGGKKAALFFMQRAWFAWLTSFSFMIYVLHAPLVVYATKAIFLWWPHGYATRMLIFILLPLTIISCSIAIGYLFRKVFPRIYRFSTGGRGMELPPIQASVPVTGKL